jgi:pseudouridine-5'-phosphate glycosidase
VHEEVAAALSDGRAVVALESAIITHGMPRPTNVEVAQAAAAGVRANGAVPAIVALADGKVHVGLSDTLLERLGAAREAVKVSVRDIAAALLQRALGGTTVAATMRAAHWAGIGVFATGGIGGVHRGAGETFDISADLLELASTPVAVVCAGAKSILDIGKTLEFLETHGVPVLGYRTDEFPAFFARTSGHKVDQCVDTPEAAAATLATHWRLGLGGVVVANPIPEADALPARDIDLRIGEAVRQAEAAGIARKDVTPYLLSQVNTLTGGRSLAANIALVKNNAAVAAQIAVALTLRGAHVEPGAA